MANARTAVLATRLFEPEAGAAAYRLAALVRALEADDWQVTVLTSRPPSGLRSGGRIRRWPVLRDRTGAVRGYLQYASFDIPLFFRLLTVRRPNVVIVEPPPTTGVVCRIVCALRHIPYVYFSADVTSRAAEGIGVNRTVVSVLRRVESWVLRGASTVLAVSGGVRDAVISLGISESAVTDVGTGIDTRLFSMAGERPSVDYPYLVYAGTMSEVHGATVFIEAFGKIMHSHPAARLLLFGQGVDVEAMRARASELDAHNIEFRGTVDGEEIARWIRGAHAGLASVRPDRGYDFAYATKAFATIGCGTPVIYAGVGPVRTLVDQNDLGWAVDWDVDAVAMAMSEALGTVTTDRERSRLSGWITENHSLDVVAREAATVIGQTAAARDESRGEPQAGRD